MLFPCCVAAREKHSPFSQLAIHADHPIISSPRQKSCAKKNCGCNAPNPVRCAGSQRSPSLPQIIATGLAKKRTFGGLAITLESTSAGHNSDDCQILNSQTLGLPYYKIRPTLALQVLGRKHNLRPHESATRNFSKLVYNKGSMSEYDTSPLRQSFAMEIQSIGPRLL